MRSAGKTIKIRAKYSRKFSLLENIFLDNKKYDIEINLFKYYMILIIRLFMNWKMEMVFFKNMKMMEFWYLKGKFLNDEKNGRWNVFNYKGHKLFEG